MASYPGSVKSFTTRLAGDVIQPAHVNDLQDEVNAIEAGLLNGTARLNSSNSTLVSLSVTGGSTLGTVSAGASTVTSLSVSGGSTLGTLQAGASTHTALVVSGGSTLGTVQAGASTVASLVVSGGSTLATLTVAGGSTFAGVAVENGQIVLRGFQTIALSSGNVNNLAIDSTAHTVVMSAPAGGSTITGFSGGVAGRCIRVVSTSGNNWVFALENAGSSADCRIGGTVAGSTVTLNSRIVEFQYINNRWWPNVGQ